MYNVETNALLRHDLMHVGGSFVNHAAISSALLRCALVCVRQEQTSHNSPAGKERTPTPTTALTMLNISLLMVAVPPPSPPRTSPTTTSEPVDEGRDGSFALPDEPTP